MVPTLDPFADTQRPARQGPGSQWFRCLIRSRIRSALPVRGGQGEPFALSPAAPAPGGSPPSPAWERQPACPTCAFAGGGRKGGRSARREVAHGRRHAPSVRKNRLPCPACKRNYRMRKGVGRNPALIVRAAPALVRCPKPLIRPHRNLYGWADGPWAGVAFSPAAIPRAMVPVPRPSAAAAWPAGPPCVPEGRRACRPASGTPGRAPRSAAWVWRPGSAPPAGCG